MESGKDTPLDEAHSFRVKALKAKGWLTKYGVCQRAEVKGYPTTPAQFRRLCEWDLLGMPQCGLWPQEAADRLIQARTLESQGARFMPRRVIRLRADFQLFPVPYSTLRRAMLKLLSAIKRPAESLHLTHRAMCWLVELRYAQYGPPKQLTQLNERLYPPAFRPEAPLPAPTTWKAILQDAELPDYVMKGPSFGAAAAVAYHWNLALEDEMKGKLTAYLRIPFEERVVMLTIRDLALAKQQQDNSAKTRADRLKRIHERLAEL